MKPVCIASLLLLAASTAFAQRPDTKAAFDKPPVPMGDTAKDDFAVQAAILKAETAWREAEFKHDVDAVQHLISTDYVGIDEKGHIWTSRELIAAFDAGPKPTGAKPQANALRMRFYGSGDVVIVTGAETTPGPKGYSARFTHFWVKSNDVWQLTGAQKTRITDVPKVTKPVVIRPRG